MDQAQINGWNFVTRASMENPSVDINDPHSVEEAWGITRSAAGINVGPLKALGYSPVWQAVTLISGKVAQLPLDVFRRKRDDSRERDSSHPAHRLVNSQFNSLPTTAYKAWRMAMVHALIWNNAYIFVDRNPAGEPIGLYSILPDRTKAEIIKGRLYYVTETTRPDGSPWLRPIPARDMLHISGLEIQPDQPIELLKLARDSWATGIAAQHFTAKFFSNGVKSGGILQVPPGVTTEYIKNLEKGLEEKYTDESKWFKTVILRDGVKFHQWTMTPVDAQMGETRTEQVREVARYFNMAPSRLGIDGSVSYNSKAEDNRSFLEDTLAPWLTAIVSECNAKLLLETEIKKNTHYFEHNTRELLRLDYKSRVQIGVMGSKGRLFTVNEWRRGENLPPIEGGDDLPSPGNSADMTGIQKGENDQPRGPAVDDTALDAERSVRRFVFEACLAARRKATNRRAYDTWINSKYDALTNGYCVPDSLKNRCKQAFLSAMEASVDSFEDRVDMITTQLEEEVCYGTATSC